MTMHGWASGRAAKDSTTRDISMLCAARRSRWLDVCWMEDNRPATKRKAQADWGRRRRLEAIAQQQGRFRVAEAVPCERETFTLF